MPALKVISWPAQVLETRAKEVTVFDDKLAQLARDMHETMDHAGGIGLAANQVGILQRVVVIYIPLDDQPKAPWHKQRAAKQPWHNKRWTFVNPRVVAFKGRHTSMEGCLSFPGQMDYVDRHVQISVEYQDLDGEDRKLDCDGLMSICLQHEIDHINGTLFTQRMNPVAARGIKERLLESAQ